MSHSSAPERASGAVITEWRPEDPAFWEQRGQRVASRNLWISVPCLLLAFCVWMLFSAVAVNLPKVGFNFTTEQLFMLTALPSVSGALLRVPYSFMVPLFGGRRWTAFSTGILIIPCVWLGFAGYHHAVQYLYYYLPAVRFCRCELCFQHGKYQLLLSKTEAGRRAGVERRPGQHGRQRDEVGCAAGGLTVHLRRFWQPRR